MDYERLEAFRRRLLGNRISLLRRRNRALADEQGLIAERELDWEDLAANETAAAALDSLSEAERDALGRIDAALERMERGTYSDCAVCRGPIDDERLQALPDTDRCAGCAASSRMATASGPWTGR